MVLGLQLEGLCGIFRNLLLMKPAFPRRMDNTLNHGQKEGEGFEKGFPSGEGLLRTLSIIYLHRGPFTQCTQQCRP